MVLRQDRSCLSIALRRLFVGVASFLQRWQTCHLGLPLGFLLLERKVIASLATFNRLQCRVEHRIRSLVRSYELISAVAGVAIENLTGIHQVHVYSFLHLLLGLLVLKGVLHRLVQIVSVVWLD